MDKQTQKNILNLVKESYRDIAEDFDITRNKRIWPELEKLASMAKDGDKVLDVGCGNGRLGKVFEEKNIKYIGVDNSSKLIEIAKKNFESRPDKYEFSGGDILELGKIPQINFDFVFSIAVLHHLPGKGLRINALKQLKNKISDNGKIILSVWNMWPQAKFRKLIFKYTALKLLGKNKMDFGDIIFEWKNNQGDKLAQRYYHAFTKFGLKQIIKKSGLETEKIYKDDHNYYAILKRSVV